VVTGDISTQRVAIEEGAYFKGKVDIQREAPKSSGAPAAGAKTEAAKPVPVSSAPAAASSVSAGAGSTGTGSTGTSSAVAAKPGEVK
jgi:hypothetical protein